MNKSLVYSLSMALMLICLSFSTSTKLEKKSLLDGKIELKIPKGFEVMSEEMMKIKYPSERRPSLVYTNESGGINVAVNWTENQSTEEMLPLYLDTFVGSFKNMYPSAEWKGNGMKSINGKQVGYLELVTPAIDTEIYNLMFFTDMEGRLLMCTFNCTKDSMEEWGSAANEIMNSLKVN